MRPISNGNSALSAAVPCLQLRHNSFSLAAPPHSRACPVFLLLPCPSYPARRPVRFVPTGPRFPFSPLALPSPAPQPPLPLPHLCVSCLWGHPDTTFAPALSLPPPAAAPSHRIASAAGLKPASLSQCQHGQSEGQPRETHRLVQTAQRPIAEGNGSWCVERTGGEVVDFWCGG